MSCLKCRNDHDGDSITCDGCDRRIHVVCSNLNPNELKVMTLRGGKRTLKFFCEDCLEGIRIIPKLLKKLDTLEEKFNQMVTGPSTQSQIQEDTITGELLERQKRCTNIVLFNLPVSDNDVNSAKLIIKDLINRDVSVRSAVRVGKSNKNGIRALKVALQDSTIVSDILRSKKDPLKRKNIYISADLTSTQRSQLNRTKEELLTRKNNGEQNLKIKYINGVPKIIEINSLN